MYFYLLTGLLHWRRLGCRIDDEQRDDHGSTDPLDRILVMGGRPWR